MGTLDKLTPLRTGSPTLLGHSWGLIHQGTGIAKGTAQRAFYGLPIRLVSLTH